VDQLTSKEVQAALEGWLGSSAIVDVSREVPNGRITGWIMHPSFAGVPAADRQSWLWNGYGDQGTLPRWDGLRGKSKGQSTQIGLILTYSKLEYENALDETA